MAEAREDVVTDGLGVIVVMAEFVVTVAKPEDAVGGAVVVGFPQGSSPRPGVDEGSPVLQPLIMTAPWINLLGVCEFMVDFMRH